MERAHAFRYLVAAEDEGTLGRELDPLVGHGCVGQRGGYHKAPQCGRPESWRLACTNGHPPEHRSPLRRRLSVSPHPTFEEEGAYTEDQGDLRDSLQLLPQRGSSRWGERDSVGQRPLCACPVADDLPERRRGVVQPDVPLHGDGILGEQDRQAEPQSGGPHRGARHLRLRLPRERQLAFQHGLRCLLRSKDLGQPLLLTRTGRAVDRERGACHREHILGRGRLTGVPIPASSGHLLVIRGFTEAGNVIINDPAAGNSSGVRRIYQRDEFHRAWFKSDSGGVAYLVRPESWPVPDRTYARGTW